MFTKLALDIATAIQGDEPTKAAIIEANSDSTLPEFVQLVLDKAETIGGFDFGDYETDDDDDDDEDEQAGRRYD